MGNQCSGCNCKKDDMQHEVHLGDSSQMLNADGGADRKPQKVHAGNLPDENDGSSINALSNS